MNRIFGEEEFDRDHTTHASSGWELPGMGRIIADVASEFDAPEQVEDVARRRFRAKHRRSHGSWARATAEARLEATRQRLVRHERQLSNSPQSRTVLRPGVTPVSAIYPVMGWTMMFVAFVMLVPIPLMVALGIQEATMTLYAIMERPWLALFYGLAPWGGVAALKLIRETFVSEAQRATFDVSLSVLTLAAFALWVHFYSTTFLADTSAGPEAAFEAAIGMGAFYKVQLLLETTAGYSAWTYAQRLLSHGMAMEQVPCPRHRLLREAEANDLLVEDAQAARLDEIDDALARYDAAEAEFVQTSLAQLADYKTRLRDMSAKALAEARIDLRQDFTKEPKDAGKETTHDE